ncbi:S-layer glycoprotein [Paenibacillus alvei]|uniref:S-layer glycoprotein n=1 Tax=Paenibacillus alvei TaxID=44250 RepID=A0AAP7A1Q2_PAEAL|nr:S-layer glycoprotein [Paenibacillus alvei]NOJ71252.1 S-layer glycoprotein [Paenibacillus alvei]
MREMNYQTSTQQNQQTKQFRGGEKKVMKKRLALLLSVAMAFSMFANVAFGADAAKTTQEKFDALKEAGVFSGYPGTTDAKLGQEMTRAEFAKVLVKLFGLKEIHGQYSYKDKNYDAKNWAAPFIEAVTAEGLMQGKDLTKKIFDFNGKITVEEASKTLVTALKLEPVKDAQNKATDWAKGYFEAAVNAGLFSKDVNPKANATRAQLVEAAFAADEMTKGPKVTSYKVIDSKTVEFTMSDKEVQKVTLDKALEPNKETEVTFTYKNKEGKEFKITTKVTYAITAAQKVASVTAENLKEIVVTFDGSVDKKSAEKKENYEVKDNKKIENVTLSDDKRSVTVLLAEESGSTLTNQKETEIKIKNVKNEDASKTLTETVKFTPIDVKIPEVKEIVGLGTKAFKVVFSEPVQKQDVFASANYKLDGYTVSGNVDYVYPNVAIINTSVSVGEHKLTVSNIKDFSGLKNVPTEKTFSVVEDTTAPEIASVKTNDLKEVEITFNETVKSVEKVYHNASGNKGTVKIKDNKVTATFTNAMYIGDNTIHVEGVTDYSGNKANREVKVNPTLDSERPTVMSVEVKQKDNGHHKLIVEFSKDLDKKDGTATKDKNYTIKNKDGKVLDFHGLTDGHPILPVTFDGDSKTKVVIDLGGKLDSGDYILEVEGVKDATYFGNTMLPYSTTFTAKNTVTDGITRAWYVSDSEDKSVRIQFETPVKTSGDGDATAKEKYEFYDIDGNRMKVEDVEVSMLSGDTVKVKGKFTSVPTSVYASYIKDSEGNFLKQNGGFRLSHTVDATNKIGVSKVKATSREEIKLELSGKVSSVDIGDFKVKVAPQGESEVTKSPTSYELADNGKTIKLKFEDSNKLPAGWDKANLHVVSSPSTRDAFGTPIENFHDEKGNDVGKVLVDEIRPEFDSKIVLNSVTNSTYEYEIQLTANENIKIKSGADFINELQPLFKVEVKDKDIQVTNVRQKTANSKELFVEFKVAQDGKNVSLTQDDVVNIEFKGDSNNTYKVITDIVGNAVAKFKSGVAARK